MLQAQSDNKAGYDASLYEKSVTFVYCQSSFDMIKNSWLLQFTLLM